MWPFDSLLLTIPSYLFWHSLETFILMCTSAYLHLLTWCEYYHFIASYPFAVSLSSFYPALSCIQQIHRSLPSVWTRQPSLSSRRAHEWCPKSGEPRNWGAFQAPNRGLDDVAWPNSTQMTFLSSSRVRVECGLKGREVGWGTGTAVCCWHGCSVSNGGDSASCCVGYLQKLGKFTPCCSAAGGGRTSRGRWFQLLSKKGGNNSSSSSSNFFLHFFLK